MFHGDGNAFNTCFRPEGNAQRVMERNTEFKHNFLQENSKGYLHHGVLGLYFYLHFVELFMSYFVSLGFTCFYHFFDSVLWFFLLLHDLLIINISISLYTFS